jgi:hypothetical protein
MRLGDGIVETACPECGAKWDCLCKCRERIRLLAVEFDALLDVAVEARALVRIEGAQALGQAMARYDTAAEARKAAP